MCRFLDFYNDKILATDYPVNAQAAWLHHRFARTHPSQDGNGRISRLLMAWTYAKGGLPPPVVSTEGKIEYILALESAHEGRLKAFSDYVGGRATEAIRGALEIARRTLAGRLNRPNGNGGRTAGDRYIPPERDPPNGHPSAQ